MIKKKFLKYRQTKVWRILFFIGYLLFSIPTYLLAHQTPTTNILLDVGTKNVNVELQIPISELDLAFGHNIAQKPENILKEYEPQLKEYLLAHIHAYKNKEEPWAIEFTTMQISENIQEAGKQAYWELIVHLKLLPNKNDDTRDFVLDYDVVMHQVVNHTAMVSIRNDWGNGLNNSNKEIGVIARDISKDVIYPFHIQLGKGSVWQGFKSMVLLGISHIAEGTDHILFILTLLLAAIAPSAPKGGTKNKYAYFWAILKIITAFTIGHSLTLLLGTIKVVNIPSKPIEVLIAITILISAIHALRPIYPKKEVLIAGGFGLIHGLAFASTLTELQLDTSTMILSILGFNIGIELMQLAIILLVSPVIVFFSRKNYYKYIRVFGASLAILLAIFWIYQRINA